MDRLATLGKRRGKLSPVDMCRRILNRYKFVHPALVAHTSNHIMLRCPSGRPMHGLQRCSGPSGLHLILIMLCTSCP